MSETVLPNNNRLHVFVTAGMQEPFDRLLMTVDSIADDIPLHLTVQSLPGTYSGRNFSIVRSLSETDYDKIFMEADIVISHAGIGTILKALRNGKPLIIFPRSASAGEHRTDHQQATSENLPKFDNLLTARDKESLKECLTILRDKHNKSVPFVPDFSPLTNYVRQYLDE